MADGHISVTPTGGAAAGEVGPRFDQQPIEVAALADACARAATIDDSGVWPAGVAAAAAWFLGDNDARVVMWDPATGGGFDGLEEDGANLNQGTESTLAFLTTLQHVRRPVAGPAMRVAGPTSDPNLALAHRQSGRLRADPARVVTQLFVPGDEGYDQQESRAAAVLRRVLALGDDEVQSAFDDVVARFSGRHHGLLETFRRHADELSGRFDPALELSATRRLLLGATFTSEYAIEGAALCNPSLVAHPDQRGVAADAIARRDERPGHRGRAPLVHRVPHRRRQRERCAHLRPRPGLRHHRPPRRDGATTPLSSGAKCVACAAGAVTPTSCSTRLGPQFSGAELEQRLAELDQQLATRPQGKRIISMINTIAARTYAVEFDGASALSERVLMPAMAAESHGMEDARFVRFAEDDGVDLLRHLHGLQRDGHHAATPRDDGLPALHVDATGRPGRSQQGPGPLSRRIGGRFAALSRSDRETNTIAIVGRPAPLDRRPSVPGAGAGLGGAATGELRLADRDGAGMAGPHPRRRAHAHLQHRCPAARPRRTDHDSRPTATAAPEPGQPTSRTGTCPMWCIPAAPCCTGVTSSCLMA